MALTNSTDGAALHCHLTMTDQLCRSTVVSSQGFNMACQGREFGE